MAIEFVPFEKAQEELGASAEQLKKLISSGAIRAFSDSGTFKFRRQDLDSFKAKQQTMSVPSAPPPAPAEPEPAAIEDIPELSLDDMEIVEEPEAPPPSQPKKEEKKPTPSTAPTLSTEELKIEEIDLAGISDETKPADADIQAEVLSIEGDLNVLDEGGGIGATQPIEIEGDAPPSAPDLGTVSMEVPADLGAERPDDFGMPAPRTGGLDVKREGSPAWAAVVAATFAILVFAGAVLAGVIKDRPVGFLEAFNEFLVDKSAIK